jgi:dTMP kinase
MSGAAFITLEGIEGVGKTSAVACVAAWLRDQGRAVALTREPGGTELGERVRALVLEHNEVPIAPLAELLLMFAARAQHLEQLIRPALARGETVVCDRFTDATYAYQGGGRGLPTTHIDSAARLVHGDLAPTLTILLDAPPEVGLGRARARSAADRFESEKVQFFERVRAAYLARAAQEPRRFAVIDASQAMEQVHRDIRRQLSERLP